MWCVEGSYFKKAKDCTNDFESCPAIACAIDVDDVLRENLLTFPVSVIRNIFIRKLSHLTISSPFILINQKMHKKPQ